MSDVQRAWQRIASWLETHAPGMLDEYVGEVEASHVDAVAERIGRAVPDDLRAFWLEAGGADPEGDAMGIFPPDWDEWEDMAFGPLPPQSAADAWDMLGELLDDGDFADLEGEPDDGVASDFWQRGWVPFADNGAGDYLCVDLAPAAGGTVGQIIVHGHETGRHHVLAASLGEYLTALADRMEDGALVYDEDVGVMVTEE